MAFPSIFIIFIICVILIQHHLRKSTRQENSIRERFWASEEKSLSTRRKEFQPSDYVRPDISILSFPSFITLEPGQDLHYQQLKHHLREYASLELMNFSELTNTDIRIRFGTANQTIISQNEANYNRFLKALADYGHFMVEFKETDEAITAFEECLRIGSDYSDHYTTLAKLYQEKNQMQKLSDLKEKAQNLNSVNKTVILKKLEAF